MFLGLKLGGYAMRDNVIWVDFSAKRKAGGKLKRFFASIISPFKRLTYISSKNVPKKSLTKVHKSI